MTWIVMTASAKVKGRAKQFGRYRRVAVVHVRYDMAWPNTLGPAMISTRARGVFAPHGTDRAIIDLGSHSVGKTARCVYRVALERAEGIAQRLNNTAPEALPAELVTYGGSA
jgi:hypothetical protein